MAVAHTSKKRRTARKRPGAAACPEKKGPPPTVGEALLVADGGVSILDDRAELALSVLAGEVRRLRAILNTPEFHDFARAVPLEAAHALNRWGAGHDAQKEPQDWFWLIGYLAGKALRAHLDGNKEKALHHCISTAGACANWHKQILEVLE